MKKIFFLLGMIGLFGLHGCHGPEGPPGNPGPDSEVFEITDVDFLSTGNFSIVANYPHTVPQAYMTLVYRLSGSDNGADVWRLLPETFYFPDGTLDFRYNFDFTNHDVSIYLEGNDLGTVPDDKRLNQIFRVVIIPGSIINTNKSSLNLEDYNAVIKAYDLENKNVKQIQL